MELVLKLWEFFVAFLRDLIGDGWTEEDLKTLRARRAEVLAMLRGGQTPEDMKGMSTEAQLARWAVLYREVFGVELDCRSIKIPARRPGFDRLIVVAKGMTPGVIFAAMDKLFGAWDYYDDFDSNIVSIRNAKNGSYAVWCRDRQEADEENRNKPANSFKQEECLTDEERKLFGVAYFRETGKHLDVKYYTICGGSRDRQCNVPCVRWDSLNRTVNVCWDYVGYRHSNRAVRSAVV